MHLGPPSRTSSPVSFVSTTPPSTPGYGSTLQKNSSSFSTSGGGVAGGSVAFDDPYVSPRTSASFGHLHPPSSVGSTSAAGLRRTASQGGLLNHVTPQRIRKSQSSTNVASTPRRPSSAMSRSSSEYRLASPTTHVAGFSTQSRPNSTSNATTPPNGGVIRQARKSCEFETIHHPSQSQQQHPPSVYYGQRRTSQTSLSPRPSARKEQVVRSVNI